MIEAGMRGHSMNRGHHQVFLRVIRALKWNRQIFILIYFIIVCLFLGSLFVLISEVLDAKFGLEGGTSSDSGNTEGALVLLGTPKACGRRWVYSQEVEVLVLINSHPDNTQNRQMIRDTWLSKTSLGSYAQVIRHVFSLGRGGATSDFKTVLKEQTTFEDLLVLDFKDTLGNITRKTLATFDWVTQSCPRAQFILKTHDDVFVNITNLMDIVDRERRDSPKGNYIVGSPAPYNQLKKAHAIEHYLKTNEYSKSKTIPYFNGGSYMFPFHVAKSLLDVSTNVAFINSEDVYIGRCIQKLGFGRNTRNGFNMDPKVAFSNSFLCKDSMVSVHKVTVTDMQALWSSCIH